MASLVNADITEIRQAPAGLSSSATMPLGVGVICLAIAALYGYGANEVNRFWHAYLLGTLYCTTLGLGGLFFVLAHHLTGGRWGTPLRRIAELVAGTLVTAAVMFLPILFFMLTGSDELYPWVNRDIFIGDKILAGKIDYLHPKWFAIRSVVYFTLWIWMARTMIGISLKQDREAPLVQAHRMQWWSGPMVVLYALSMNFAAFDWLMTLEPHWFSTMFGVYFFAGSFPWLPGFVDLLVKPPARSGGPYAVDHNRAVSRPRQADVCFCLLLGLYRV